MGWGRRAWSGLFVFVFAAAPSLAANITEWTFSIPTTSSGNFSASEATSSSTILGSFSRLSHGFLQLTVTGGSGTDKPANGTVQFAIEQVGNHLFAPPILTSETKLLVATVSGTCPTQPWTGILVNYVWAGTVGTSYDTSLATTPAFGLFSWDPASSMASITDVRNLTSYSTLSGFTSFSLSGTCSNGTITFTGAGDRGGTLYLNPARGGVFVAQTQRSMFILPQYSIPSASVLNGTYAGFSFEAGATEVIGNLRMTISSGTSATGYALSDTAANTNDTGKRWDFANITINSPFSGAFTADVTYNSGSVGKATCVPFINTKTLIFCASQTPGSTATPMNFVLLSDSQALASGSLDSYSFGSGGRSTADIGSGTADKYSSIALTSSGQIVAVGRTNSAFDTLIARYWENGVLDTTFSGDGITITTANSSRDDYAQGVLVQNDGKIVAVGRYNTGASAHDFMILRYTTAGSLDTTWDTDGIRTDTYSNKNEAFYGVVQQTDEKIIAVGYCGNGTAYDACAYRYTTSGALDTTWGTGGKKGVQLNATGSDDAYFASLATDGKLYVFGSDDAANSAVMRFTTTGAVDSTFNTNGFRVTTFSGSNDVFYGGLVQSDGKPVGCGYDGPRWALARYTTGGALDTTFNSTGTIAFSFPAPMGVDGSCYNIAQQSDGKLVGVGYAKNANKDFGVIRLTTGGVLDTSFDSDGMFTTSGGTGDDVLETVAIQRDGKILAAGYSTSSTQDVHIIRLWP